MQLPFGLDLTSFVAGAGFVLALAFFVFLINVWWREATSPFRPQIVPQVTKKTPWQVVARAFASILQFVGSALLAAALALFLFAVPFEEVRLLGLVGLLTLAIGTVLKLIAR